MKYLGRIIIVLVLVGIGFGSSGCGGPIVGSPEWKAREARQHQEMLAKPGKLNVEIRTEPLGASVYDGDKYWGVTPLSLTWPVLVKQYNSGRPFRCSELQFYKEGYMPGKKAFRLRLYPDERSTNYQELIVLEPDPRVVVRRPASPQQYQQRQSQTQNVIVQQQPQQQKDTTADDFIKAADFMQRSVMFNKMYGQ